MFGRIKINQEMMKMLRPTSKAAAKMQCLYSCGGDLEKAERLYNFLIKDMDLPDFDVPQPNAMEQAKTTFQNAFEWVKENREDILSAVDYIRTLRGKKVPSKTPLPPLNGLDV